MRTRLTLLTAVAAAALFGWKLSGPPPAFSHETLTTTVLFDREIVRILDNHCVMCHAPNGAAFPLVTYEETWLRRRAIRSRVLARHMPPWPAVPGYGEFLNENRLTLRETQFVISWVEGLGPRNAGTVFLNVSDSTAVARRPVEAHADFGHWRLGPPDLTSALAPQTIEAGQANQVRRTIVDPGLKAERRIRAIEYLPGDRRVVRAAFFTVQETGQWLGSWTPWHGFMSLPEGAAYRLAPGSHVAAEIHYRGADAPVVDRGAVGLFFATQPAPNRPSDLVLEAKGSVPAGVPTHKFRSRARLAANTRVLALRAETQPGVQSIEVSARRPDGGTEILLFAKDLSMDWPTPYIFKQPVLLGRGADIFVTTTYTNPSATAQPGGFRLTVSKY